jgi:coenzyme PQQ synthesis protein D (PqqD)
VSVSSPPSSDPAQPRPRPAVLFRRLGDGGVIVDLHHDQIFELNDTGARIWEAIESGVTIAALPALLTSEFHIDSETAASEVRRLVDELLRAGLLER